MSQIFSRDGAHPETQPLRQIDNSQLYENIGNIVIERAHAGDDQCFDIYKRAVGMTIENSKETVNG